MIKFLLSIIFAFVLLLPAPALPIDTTTTVYKDGEFTTQCQRRVKSSNEISTDVTDYLVTDFHNSPGHLFTWALKDLGLQEKKNNELIIVFVSSNHDKRTGITHGVFDIEVPNITSFKNIKVNALVAKTKYMNGTSKVTADIAYSSMLLDKANGYITVIPQKNNEQLYVTNFKIKFGWFFNIFITQNRYKKIVEWRVRKFTDNMKFESEERQRNEKL
ncbi:MAG: hypothetical protein WCJ61_17430 [Paludibacter sp.]